MTDETNDVNVDNLNDEQLDNLFNEMANEPEEVVEPEKSATVEEPVEGHQEEETEAQGEPEPDLESEPESEPEPEQEPVKESKKDDEIERNKNAALQEARKENRLLQKQLQELAEKNEKLVKTFESAFSEKKPDEVIPDKEEDPIGYLQYKNSQLEKQVEEINQFKNMTTEERKQAEEGQRFVNTYRQHLNKFAQEHQDFNDAYQFALKSKVDEYKVFGLTEEAAITRAREDEAAIAYEAMQDGVNPAERIYQFAKLRGFTEKGNVNNTSPVAKGHAQVDANTKIETIKRGQKASTSLNQAGHNPGKKYTLNDIANLPDSEFESVDWDEDVLSQG